MRNRNSDSSGIICARVFSSAHGHVLHADGQALAAVANGPMRTESVHGGAPTAMLDPKGVNRMSAPIEWLNSPPRTPQSTYRGVIGAQIGANVHEMALTQSVVDAVCEHAAGRRVHSVKLEVGALCAVVPDAMTFCFELATEGTVADGATLEVDMRPGEAQCRSCGTGFELNDVILLCPCGSADVEVLAGRDLKILSMEVS